MNNNPLKISALVLFLLLEIIASRCMADSNPTSINLSTFEVNPFMYHSNGLTSNKEIRGINHDIVEAVAAEIDIKVNFVFSPFRRNYLDLLQGNSEATLVLLIPDHTEELFSQFLVNAVPFYEMRVGAITHRARNLTLTSPEDFANYRVGHIRLIPQIHDQLAPQNPNRETFANSVNLIKALLADRIDIAIISPSLLVPISRELNFSADLLQVALEFPPQPLTIAWSKNSQRQDLQELSKRFDEALLRLKKQGKVREIIQRYVDPALFYAID